MRRSLITILLPAHFTCPFPASCGTSLVELLQLEEQRASQHQRTDASHLPLTAWTRDSRGTRETGDPLTSTGASRFEVGLAQIHQKSPKIRDPRLRRKVAISLGCWIYKGCPPNTFTADCSILCRFIGINNGLNMCIYFWGDTLYMIMGKFHRLQLAS